MKQNQKGVTLISLVAAIVIMLILTSIVVTNVYTGSDYKKYKLMCSDIEMIEEKTLLYYNQYRELPLLDEVSQGSLPEGADLDTTHSFYKIDVGKLGGLTLHHSKDKYIIDTTTLEVYYLDGIEYKGTTFYSN